MFRDETKEIHIGNKVIGHGNPILIQSMTNTKTEDVKATIEQIHRLETAGCEIVRSTVPTLEAAKAIKEIKKEISIPLVADIHFDYKMAVAAIETELTKSELIPVTSEQMKNFWKLLRLQKKEISPSVWA